MRHLRQNELAQAGALGRIARVFRLRLLRTYASNFWYKGFKRKLKGNSDQPSLVIMAAVADPLQLSKHWRETEYLLRVLGAETSRT